MVAACGRATPLGLSAALPSALRQILGRTVPPNPKSVTFLTYLENARRQRDTRASVFNPLKYCEFVAGSAMARELLIVFQLIRLGIFGSGQQRGSHMQASIHEGTA